MEKTFSQGRGHNEVKKGIADSAWIEGQCVHIYTYIIQKGGNKNA